MSLQSGDIKELTTAKIVLMFGVVLIHCNVVIDLPDSINPMQMTGSALVEFVSHFLCRCCVPAFFIISGFLFFRNFPNGKGIDKLATSYKKKMSSRIRSLLIPYILWNIIGVLLFLIKCYCFNFNSLGVIVDNQIQWGEFFKGFLFLKNGYPYDFPLWFLRDLIFYIALTPILYYLARNTILFILSVCVIFLLREYNSGINFFSVIYFLVGSYVGLHEKYYSFIRIKSIGITSLILWITLLATIFFLKDIPGIAERLISFISNIAGCCAIIFIGIKTHKCKLRLSPQAVFFIYAIHGLYCTLVRKTCLGVSGYETSIQILVAYVGTFVILVSSSLCLYYLTKKLFPKFALIMSGGR